MMKWAMAMLLAAMLCAGGALAQDELRFAEQGFQWMDGARYMTLSGGRVGGLSYEASGERYIVTDADGRACAWGDGLLAEDGLQPEMLPRSIEEAARMNRVRAYLNDTGMLGWRDTADLGREEALPVYAAPSEDAWRGKSGTAAVSLASPFTVLGADPDGWLLIEYAESEAERRIGYIRKPEGMQSMASGVWTIPLPLTLAEDAAMTDDPHGGMRAIARFRAGDTVTCLGYMDALWVYAQTEIDGREARGFLPMRAFAEPNEARLTDVEARLVGSWWFYTGGSMLGADGAIFCADGTMTEGVAEDPDAFPPERLIPEGEPRAYAVYAAPAGRYAGVPYVLELRGDDGSAVRYGFAFGTDPDWTGVALDVRQGEGGGGYLKLEEGLAYRPVYTGECGW